MRRRGHIFCFLLLSAIALHAQVPLSVGYQKKIEISVAGATAAYSLDSSIVEASAANGMVQLDGRAPGTANVVIVTTAGVQTVAVVVPVPPPVYPPGFVPPQREGSTSEAGAVEVRYNSDPSQLTNSIELRRTQDQSFDRLQLVNANLFSRNSSQGIVGFPLASYEIGRPRYDVTFVDQAVNNTPLTLDNYLVRGLHVREGDWYLHGGFTSVAIFQGLFLATDPEYVAGASRRFRLNKYSALEANFYYFQNPAKELTTASNGGVGSVDYIFRRGDKLSLLTELGVSRGVGFASRGAYDDKKTHIAGSLRLQPQRFAALAVNNQHGTFGDLNASREINQRLFATLSVNESNFNLPALNQSTFTTDGNLTYKLSTHFSLLEGLAFSRFKSTVPATATAQTLNVPLGIDFSTRHFGSGFQYQRTFNFDGSGGNDYAVNVRGTGGPFLFSAYFRHDVQVPTVAAIFAQLPGLEDLLTRAGIVATTPDDLAQLLRNSALLATLGFTAPLTINLAPSRNDSGASISWGGKGPTHPQVNLNYFNSNTQLVQGSFKFTTGTLSYSQRVTASDDVFASASLIRTVNGPSPQVQPVYAVSIRHKLSSVPGMLLPGRHGVIQGHVFRDDDATARYNTQLAGLAGVEVRLDDDRITHTDERGFYSFHRVPFGPHRLEARMESAEPFFYTTDSPTTADMNSTVDFGINFSKGQVYGFLLNDAGKGVGGVTIEMEGAVGKRSTQTGSDGKFMFPGLGPGTYTIRTEAGSYPLGYSLQNLPAGEVSIEAGKSGKVELNVRAIRAVSGKVTAYDQKDLKPVPLAGVIVRLKELSLETRTGTNGAYIFRNLPAGSYTVVTTYNGREISRSVTVPPEPANLRDIDLDTGAR